MKERTDYFYKSIAKQSKNFLDNKMASSILLLLGVAVAFIWANSIHASSYFLLWDTPIVLSIGNFVISNSLGHWVNDGLMVIFFFLIGLEIKRELLVGELSSIQKAVLPAMAALGGMIVPAAIYLAINQGGPGIVGWGIPMATDIAFALACLTALGSAVPPALKVLLLALAIFDDMGAVLVIAVFYTDHINLISLGFGIVIITASLFLNIKGVRKTYPYTLLGIALWFAFFLSGIHATIAGVLLALTIPARSRYDQMQFKTETEDIIRNFPEKDFHLMVTDEKQREMMHQLKKSVDNLNSPLQKLEDRLYPFVNYIVLPIFALANAGVNITQGSTLHSPLDPILIGIIAGLFIGKPLGITFFSWLAVKLRLAQLPDGIRWSQIWALSCLGGIGFTMSLFITNLAFTDPLFIYEAKLAILIASILAAILGIALFLFIHSRKAGAANDRS